jgi:AGZA family xanthine/uracil permease-like MFS transporter
VIVSIAIVSLVGLFIPDGDATVTALPGSVVALPPSIAPTLFQLDVGWMFRHFLTAFPVVVALLFIDLFDSMGTLIGVSQRAGLLDKEGHLPKIHQALKADAGGTLIGAVLGTSTNTCYIESAAGVEAGGRTGLAALTTAFCFLLALFVAPIIEAVPDLATAPALIIVGVFMIQTASEIDFHDFAIAVPAVLTIVVMPLAFSISTGLAVGYVMYVVMMLGARRAKEVSAVSCVLAAVFLLHLVFQ